MAPGVGETGKRSGNDAVPAHVSATLRTDGGARGNPGPAGAGFVLAAADGAIIAQGGRFLGESTNNVAEYEALIWGLETAAELGVRRIAVFCDSELVVRQVTGVYRVKHENMKPLFVRALALLRTFESFDVRHVRRAENVAADALVNEAIDVRGQVGDAIELARQPDQGSLFD
jgi:ribonuclease HI